VILLTVAALYGLLWWLTSALGVPAARVVALRAMGDIPASGVDISTADSSRRYSSQYPHPKGSSWHTYTNAPPWYYCHGSAYAPLLIRIDYGWKSGPLRGDGGSAWHVWVFGAVFRAYEFQRWAI
jgi:hypothetical protein